VEALERGGKGGVSVHARRKTGQRVGSQASKPCLNAGWPVTFDRVDWFSVERIHRFVLPSNYLKKPAESDPIGESLQ